MKKLILLCAVMFPLLASAQPSPPPFSSLQVLSNLMLRSPNFSNFFVINSNLLNAAVRQGLGGTFANSPHIDLTKVGNYISTNANFTSSLLSADLPNIGLYRVVILNTSTNSITNFWPKSFGAIGPSNTLSSSLVIPGLTRFELWLRTDAATNWSSIEFGADNPYLADIVNGFSAASDLQVPAKDAASGRFVYRTISGGGGVSNAAPLTLNVPTVGAGAGGIKDMSDPADFRTRIGAPGLTNENAFTGQNTFSGQVRFYPSNTIAGTKRIFTVNGSQTLTSTNGAFAGRLIGDDVAFDPAFYPPSGRQMRITGIVSDDLAICYEFSTFTTSTTNYDIYPIASRLDDINGVQAGYIANDGSVGIIVRALPNTFNSARFDIIDGTNSWTMRTGGPLAGSGGSGVFLIGQQNGPNGNDGVFQIQSQSPYESILIKRPDGDIAFRGVLTNRFGGTITLKAATIIDRGLTITSTNSFTGPGTAGSSGTVVTGTSTTFLTTFAPGDRIFFGGQGATIRSVDSNTNLTLFSVLNISAGSAYNVQQAQLNLRGLSIASRSGFDADGVLNFFHEPNKRIINAGDWGLALGGAGELIFVNNADTTTTNGNPLIIDTNSNVRVPNLGTAASTNIVGAVADGTTVPISIGSGLSLSTAKVLSATGGGSTFVGNPNQFSETNIISGSLQTNNLFYAGSRISIDATNRVLVSYNAGVSHTNLDWQNSQLLNLSGAPVYSWGLGNYFNTSIGVGVTPSSTDGQVTATNALVVVGNSTGSALVINTNQLVVTNGNVGIGTIIPTAALHVYSTNTPVFTVSGTAGTNLFTVSTNGDVVVSGSISVVTNIASFNVFTNDFVLGTRYTNGPSSGFGVARRAFVSASFTLNAATAGTATVTLYCEQGGGITNKARCSAGPLVGQVNVEQLTLFVGPGAIFRFEDEDSGAGASSVIVSGTSSWTGL